MRHFVLALAALLLSQLTMARDLSITTAHDSDGENATREQLGRLLDTYDLDKWIFTGSVMIDERAIPHSHPVLTLHTRHRKNDLELLSTFVHEEIHWHLVAKDDQTREAISELVKMYPSVPAGGREGAGDTASTYLHLIVNYLEFRAMKELVGDEMAEDIFDFWATDHYTWIYQTVMSDETRIGEIVAGHGLSI